MRRFSTLAAVVLLSAFAWNCETTQPTEIAGSQATVAFEARALTYVYDVYELWIDTDGDGTPDTRGTDPDSFCVQVTDEDGQPVTANSLVPWPYLLVISAIRAGTTTPEILGTTLDTAQPYSNVTPYDTSAGQAPIRNPQGNVHYLNPRRLARTNLDYLLAKGDNCGYQTLDNLPTPNVLGQTNPAIFDVALDKGDTIMVKAVKQVDPDLGVLEILSEAQLAAELTVDGRSTSPLGTSATSFEPGTGFAFSFTSQ